MLKEYCDKCGTEIDRFEKSDRNRISVQLPDAGRSFGKVANFTLCKKCYEELGIERAVDRIGTSDREKVPEAAEKLVGILKELICSTVQEELQ